MKLAYYACSIILFAISARHVFGDSNDEVLTVPGYNGPPLCWKHYAGYLPTEGEKHLFYWYHEATSDPLKKPLILWLNGKYLFFSAPRHPFNFTNHKSLTVNTFNIIQGDLVVHPWGECLANLAPL